MNRKGLLIGFSAYAMWGALPLFWHGMTDVDSLIILCARVICSALFALLLLAFTGRVRGMLHLFKNGRVALRLFLSSLLVTVNWGLYIWAVNSGHVLDASLGYYINPLMNVALGVLLFRERCTGLDLVALGLALVGVIISTVSYGAFPWTAVLLAALFAGYGALKKDMHLDATEGMCAETLLMTPFALLFLLLSKTGQATLSALTLRQGLLLLACGPVTAVPLILFARGVNDLSLSTMGFLQFVSPTLMLITGVLFLGERFTPGKAVAFGFILTGLAVYTVGLAVRERKNRGGTNPGEEARP